MQNPNLTEGDTLPNKVEINLNMLRAFMLDQIGGEVDNTDIVTIHQVTGEAMKLQRHHWPRLDTRPLR
jgi:hypothetical protein